MRFLVIALFGFALSACSKPSDDLVAQFEIARKARKLTEAEECEWHTKLAAAYLKEQNAEKYKSSDLSARIYCMRASQIREYGY